MLVWRGCLMALATHVIAGRVSPNCTWDGRFFDGSNIEDLSSICDTNGWTGFSVAMTVRMDAAPGYYRPFTFGPSSYGSADYIQVYNSWGNLVFAYDDGGGNIRGWSGVPVGEKARYLISLSKTGRMRLHRDGTKMAEKQASTSLRAVDRRMFFGVHSFPGVIEDVYIFDDEVEWDSVTLPYLAPDCTYGGRLFDGSGPENISATCSPSLGASLSVAFTLRLDAVDSDWPSVFKLEVEQLNELNNLVCTFITPNVDEGFAFLRWGVSGSDYLDLNITMGVRKRYLVTFASSGYMQLFSDGILAAEKNGAAGVPALARGLLVGTSGFKGLVEDLYVFGSKVDWANALTTTTTSTTTTSTTTTTTTSSTSASTTSTSTSSSSTSSTSSTSSSSTSSTSSSTTTTRSTSSSSSTTSSKSSTSTSSTSTTSSSTSSTSLSSTTSISTSSTSTISTSTSATTSTSSTSRTTSTSQTSTGTTATSTLTTSSSSSMTTTSTTVTTSRSSTSSMTSTVTATLTSRTTTHTASSTTTRFVFPTFAPPATGKSGLGSGDVKKVVLAMDVQLADLTKFNRTELEAQLNRRLGAALGGMLRILEVTFKMQVSYLFAAEVEQAALLTALARRHGVDEAQITLASAAAGRRLASSALDATITSSDAAAADALVAAASDVTALATELATVTGQEVPVPTLATEPVGSVDVVTETAVSQTGADALLQDQSALSAIAFHSVQEVLPGALVSVQEPITQTVTTSTTATTTSRTSSVHATTSATTTTTQKVSEQEQAEELLEVVEESKSMLVMSLAKSNESVSTFSSPVAVTAAAKLLDLLQGMQSPQPGDPEGPNPGNGSEVDVVPSVVVPVEGTDVEVAVPVTVFEEVVAAASEAVVMLVTVFNESQFASVPGVSSASPSIEQGEMPTRAVTAVISIDFIALAGNESRELEVGNLQNAIEFSMPTNYTPGLTCAFWDEKVAAWSTDGVSLSPRSKVGGLLFCLTTHLSLFGAIWQAFVATLGCSQVSLLTLEALRAVFESDWYGYPGTLVVWALLVLFVAMFAMAHRLDKRDSWRLDYFLMPAGLSPDEEEIATQSRSVALDFDSGVSAASRGLARARIAAPPDFAQTTSVATDGSAASAATAEGGEAPTQQSWPGITGCVAVINYTMGNSTVREAMQEIIHAWCRELGLCQGFCQDCFKIALIGPASLSTATVSSAKVVMACRRALKSVALLSAQRLAGARICLSNEMVMFVLEDPTVFTLLCRYKEELQSPSRRHVDYAEETGEEAWHALHEEVTDSVLQELDTQQERWILGMAWKLFLVNNPFAAVLIFDPFYDRKLRTFLFLVDQALTLVVMSLFFENTGERRKLVGGCSNGAFMELTGYKIGRFFAIGLASAFLSTFPIIFLESLQTRSMVRVPYKGSPAWEKQLKVWRTQDRLIYGVGAALFVPAIIFLHLFLANSSAEDHENWLIGASLVLVQDWIMLPFSVALALPLTCRGLLMALKLSGRVDLKTLTTEQRVAFFEKTNAMLPLMGV